MVNSFPSMVMFFLVCLLSSWKSLGSFSVRSATLASEYSCNYKIRRGYLGKIEPERRDTFKFPVSLLNSKYKYYKIYVIHSIHLNTYHIYLKMKSFTYVWNNKPINSPDPFPKWWNRPGIENKRGQLGLWQMGHPKPHPKAAATTHCHTVLSDLLRPESLRITWTLPIFNVGSNVSDQHTFKQNTFGHQVVTSVLQYYQFADTGGKPCNVALLELVESRSASRVVWTLLCPTPKPRKVSLVGCLKYAHQKSLWGQSFWSYH